MQTVPTAIPTRRILVLALALLVAPRAAASADEPASAPLPAGEAPSDAAPEVVEDLPLLPSERAPGVPLEARTRVAPTSVVGAVPERAVPLIPGTVHVVEVAPVLRKREVTSVQDAMRSLPGVTVRPEVGSGLIPNIGVRGLNPDRSEKMLILEDGVPAGFAPYIENAAYYVPPFERMRRIELLKGSGQILHGPHTVGGVLNLITPPLDWCDACLHGSARVVVGSDGYRMGVLDVGQRIGAWSWLIQAVGKEGDGYRDHSDFEFLDTLAKVRWAPRRGTAVTLKVDRYTQDSKDTYLGLTQGMYDEDPYQNPVRYDRLEIDWTSAQLTWEQHLAGCWDLVVQGYWSEATRDWNRQDFARNAGFAAAPGNTIETVGDTTIDGGAIYLRESYGSRDRDFEKWGVEARLLGTHSLAGRRAESQVGVRFHAETMTDERNNRTTLGADPVTAARDVREVDAWAFFAQERIHLSNRFTVSGGLRVEAIESRRRTEIAGGVPTIAEGSTDDLEWIPGAGFTWQTNRCTTVFGGVHRGFSPPRTAQAIASDGEDLELDAERSWNYELGVRGRLGGWFGYEVTGFYYDFQNQVVPDNESGGTSTEVVNAGETRHLGVESLVTADLTQALTGRCDRCRTAVYLDLGYTYLDTENVTPNGLFEGNRLPYAPEHQAFVGVRVEFPVGLTLSALGTYTDDQFADQANTREGSADGRRGLIGDRFLLDLKASWRIPRSRWYVSAAWTNVFDETYIASRAPEGIFPGAPSSVLVSAGIDF